MAKEFFTNAYSTYKSEMDWAKTVEGVRQGILELGEVICNIANEDRYSAFIWSRWVQPSRVRYQARSGEVRKNHIDRLRRLSPIT